MYIGSNASAFRAHLKHNFPANMWYTTSRNGIVQLVHARFAEVAINERRRNLTPGHATQHFDIWKNGEYGDVMHFTDRTEAYEVSNEKPRRMFKGVVGNMKEYERFCDHFVVLKQEYFYVPTPTELRIAGGWNEGYLCEPDDFQNILKGARTRVDISERDFR